MSPRSSTHSPLQTYLRESLERRPAQLTLWMANRILNTPTAERFMLTPGVHYVKLVHPHFAPVTREVQIERGQVLPLHVTLTERLPALGSAK